MIRTLTCAASLAASVLFTLGWLNMAAAVNYTYTGGGSNPNDWQDAGNWTSTGGPGTVLGYPGQAQDGATIPNGFSPTFVNMPATTLHTFNTGNSLVTLSSALQLAFNGVGQSVSPTLQVGTGGITGVSISSSNGEDTWQVAGNLTLSGTFSQTAKLPTVVGTPTFDVTTFHLPWTGTANFGAWNFADANNLTFSSQTITNSTVNFQGTPNFNGGRPDWNITNGGDNGRTVNLNAHTMLGDVLTLAAWSNSGVGLNRFSRLIGNGATIDMNQVVINDVAAGAVGHNYLDLENTTIYVRGTSGTVWNNNSRGNTSFDLLTNTTVHIDPAGGPATVSINPRSQNLGASGFTNNFAFDNLTLGGGDTVTVTGTAHAGGGSATLYVNGELTGESGATLNLNTRNAYVNGELTIGDGPGTFTVSNGDLRLTSAAQWTVDIDGNTPGVTYDQLVLSNAALHLNDAELVLDLAGGLPNGLYFLVDNQGAFAIDGTFAGLEQGATISIAGQPALMVQISYLADSGSNSFLGGNDIALQVFLVPEPSSALLASIGACGMVTLRRKKRASATRVAYASWAG